MSRIPENFDDLYAQCPNYYSAPSDGLIECIDRYSVGPCPALDVGCGQGRNALWLARQGFEVVGIDTSESAIAALRRRAKKLDLPIVARVQDVNVFDPGPGLFGLEVVQTTLNHLDEASIPQVCSRLSRALRPGGILYCVAFTTQDPGFSGDSVTASECATLVRHYFRPNELRELFADLSVLLYSEYMKEDLSHGPAHFHGKAKLVAKAVDE